MIFIGYIFLPETSDSFLYVLFGAKKVLLPPEFEKLKFNHTKQIT